MIFIIYFAVDLSLINDPDQECIYLCGNSLGLQPKTAREYVNRQFDKWEKM
jgi:kynureninase